MDWNNANHLMQAGLVASCVFIFVMGYRAGDKT